MNSGQCLICVLRKALTFLLLIRNILHHLPLLSDLKENIAVLQFPIPKLSSSHFLSLVWYTKIRLGS